MFQSHIGDESGSRRLARCPWLVLAGAASLIAFSILVRGLNHDEGQYVGAIALMRRGWPYRDFAYLQTPLQPLVLSPLALIPAGWLLFLARVANGLFALCALYLLAKSLKGRARPENVLIAVAAAACSEPLLWGASLARNDTLPMLLLAGAVAALLRALSDPKRLVYLSIGGSLLGLAISAKISAAVPSAGALLYVILRWRSFGPRAVTAFGAAGAAGLLPCVVLAFVAPAQFRFDVFTYSLQAPAQWWASVGRADMLEFPHRIFRLLHFAAEGIILVGLVAAVLDRRRSEERLFLDLMIIGGAIGAYVPEPAYPQYLIPLLPPLVPRFALALDGLADRWRGPVLAATAGFCVFGLQYTAHQAFRSTRTGSALVAAITEGRRAARIAEGRTIATLSPEIIAGADTNLDPRFVTGPFLYRTSGTLAANALRFGYSPNWQRVGIELDARPPGAILVGGEARPHPHHPQGLDGRLKVWARAHGYSAVSLRDEHFTLFIRP